MLVNDFVQIDMRLSNDQEKVVEHIMSPYFPWFYQESTSARYMFLGHTLMLRDVENRQVSGKINSDYYPLVKTFFDQFCEEAGITNAVVLRSCINLTYYDPAGSNDIHVDHKFPHNNFVMYLNEFTGGETLLYDEDGKCTKEIIPKKFRACVFPGVKHNNRFCASGERRVVFVLTFA
jgi:hypothetical protein